MVAPSMAAFPNCLIFSSGKSGLVCGFVPGRFVFCELEVSKRQDLFSGKFQNGSAVFLFAVEHA